MNSSMDRWRIRFLKENCQYLRRRLPASAQPTRPPAKKRCNDRSQRHKDQSQPTGVILDLAEQSTTLAEETCKDVKLIKETVLKLVKSLEALQKAVEESNKKLNEHIASALLQLAQLRHRTMGHLSCPSPSRPPSRAWGLHFSLLHYLRATSPSQAT